MNIDFIGNLEARNECEKINAVRNRNFIQATKDSTTKFPKINKLQIDYGRKCPQ